MARWCAVVLLAVIAGCDRKEAPAAGAANGAGVFRAVVTVPALAGLVKPMLPEGAELKMLMPPGRSEHGYELTPADIAALGRADLVVYIGMGLEPQVRAFLENQKSERRRVVCFGEVVGLQKPGEVIAPHEHGHEHEEDAHEGPGLLPPDTGWKPVPPMDPHLWLDPVMVMQLVPAVGREIEAGLAERGAVDEAARARIAKGEEDVLAEVRAVDREYRDRLAPLAGRSIVTHHAAFGRLAARYGLRIAEVIRPIETSEPTPGQIAEVVDAVKTRGVTVIFVEPQFSAAAAERVAAAAGVQVGRLDPIGSGDWQGMMRANLDELVRKLSAATARTQTGAAGPR